MPIVLTWSEIAIRLLYTVAAGAVIGTNRSEHARAAGLRTSILVSLAACIAMLQVNLLLPLAGRSSDSFVMNDLMRLPLGILSGMGFIGAGTIVRRDNVVVGLTTASTMWFLTVIGLCFGGGQIALGLVGVALSFVVLTVFKVVEDHMKQDHRGKLLIVTNATGPDEDEIRAILQNEGFRVSALGFSNAPHDESHQWNYELHWRAKPDVTTVPSWVRRLADRDDVVRVSWTLQAR
jgi:putative Mg2+ transporter-C (MgtC) family protein